MSRDHGWREFNPSHNGLGVIGNCTLFGPGDLPDHIITKHPDIVIITLGLNDNFAFPESADAIHTQIGADFTRLKHALPHARFIVVEPFWYTDDRPPSVEIIGGWVTAAAAEIHADFIPSDSHWIEHYPEWMASDGLHPNDAGYAAIANRMDAALAATPTPSREVITFWGASCRIREVDSLSSIKIAQHHSRRRKWLRSELWKRLQVRMSPTPASIIRCSVS